MRPMDTVELMIANELKSTWPGEQIRVQRQPRDMVMGFAIEVTRELLGDEYSYVGWVSVKVIQTNSQPWRVDQREMIERAFAETMKDLKVH